MKRFASTAPSKTNFCLSLGPYHGGSVDFVFHVCLLGKMKTCLTDPPHYDITCFIDGMHAPKEHLLDTAMQEEDFLTSLGRNNFGKSAKAATQDYSREVWKTLLSQGFTRSSNEHSAKLMHNFNSFMK